MQTLCSFKGADHNLNKMTIPSSPSAQNLQETTASQSPHEEKLSGAPFDDLPSFPLSGEVQSAELITTCLFLATFISYTFCVAAIFYQILFVIFYQISKASIHFFLYFFKEISDIFQVKWKTVLVWSLIWRCSMLITCHSDSENRPSLEEESTWGRGGLL